MSARPKLSSHENSETICFPGVPGETDVGLGTVFHTMRKEPEEALDFGGQEEKVQGPLSKGNTKRFITFPRILMKEQCRGRAFLTSAADSVS